MEAEIVVIINNSSCCCKDEEEAKRFVWLHLSGGSEMKVKIIIPEKTNNPDML